MISPTDPLPLSLFAAAVCYLILERPPLLMKVKLLAVITLGLVGSIGCVASIF
jgi:hypothetical protein